MRSSPTCSERILRMKTWLWLRSGVPLTTKHNQNINHFWFRSNIAVDESENDSDHPCGWYIQVHLTYSLISFNHVRSQVQPNVAVTWRNDYHSYMVMPMSTSATAKVLSSTKPVPSRSGSQCEVSVWYPRMSKWKTSRGQGWIRDGSGIELEQRNELSWPSLPLKTSVQSLMTPRVSQCLGPIIDRSATRCKEHLTTIQLFP